MTSTAKRSQVFRVIGMDTLPGQYLEWLRICGRSKRTISDRRDILHRIDTELPYGLEQATSDELKEWIFRDGWSASTRETYYGCVRSFFTWACNPRSPKLDFDPMAELPRPTTPRGLPRPVTDVQLQHILSMGAEPFHTWSLLAAYAGLRCIEIAGLHREHVTQESLTVVRGKGGRPGVVPTHPAIWSAIVDLPGGQIAHTTTGDPASDRYVSIRSALYFRRNLKMPGVGLHRLRHWYGTTIYRNTRDIRRTQELLRHSSPTTTAIYTLVTSEERLAAIQTLPTF